MTTVCLLCLLEAYVQAMQSSKRAAEQKLTSLELDHAVLTSEHQKLAKAKQTQGAYLRFLQRQLEVQHLYQVVTLRRSVHKACMTLVVVHLTHI